MSNAGIIRYSVSAIDAGKALGLTPDSRGFCQCPIHGEKTGSMKLYPGQRGWYCFGCHRGGDVIDLAMICLNCDFKGAVAWFDDTYRLGLKKDLNASERKETQNRAIQLKNAWNTYETVDKFLNDLKCIVDGMALKIQQDMEKSRRENPNYYWSDCYFEAASNLHWLQEKSDRLAYEADENRKWHEAAKDKLSRGLKK